MELVRNCSCHLPRPCQIHVPADFLITSQSAFCQQTDEDVSAHPAGRSVSRRLPGLQHRLQLAAGDSGPAEPSLRAVPGSPEGTARAALPRTGDHSVQNRNHSVQNRKTLYTTGDSYFKNRLSLYPEQGITLA